LVPRSTLVGENESNPGALPPKEAAGTFTIPDDLAWEQVLAEPHISQPVFLNFDERGRMWVMEYRQYPYPAGLKMVSKDNFWRAVYDKVPEPPSKGPKGADRISIHEDTNGDGTFDSHKVFVDGLNIASSFVKGRGGVWVLNPPYLLFYPDENNDDVPDSDPIVHLSGFGMQDTHSVVNSLRWGPDGWLYAAQGSTVSGNVLRPGLDKIPKYSMGQLIWRYHPEKKIYEIFAEGGGNAFGVELDSQGRIYSGHNGGNTRGFHYVQGGYFQKGFGKHGPLSNPYSFGYFEAMQHPPVERFTHNFVLYEGGTLPDDYHGRLFGVEPLQGRVVMSEVSANGSTRSSARWILNSARMVPFTWRISTNPKSATASIFRVRSTRPTAASTVCKTKTCPRRKSLILALYPRKSWWDCSITPTAGIAKRCLGCWAIAGMLRSFRCSNRTSKSKPGSWLWNRYGHCI
jgi:hypothetical protein